MDKLQNLMDLNASEIINELTKDADVSKDVNVRIVDEIEIGQAIRQGDIYVHCVSSDHPHGDKLNTSQLAEGNSKGSRHIAESPSVTYQGTIAPPTCSTTLIGPLIKSDKPFWISHPEHANFYLPPGTYQVTHQLDARTLKRVKD